MFAVWQIPPIQIINKTSNNAEAVDFPLQITALPSLGRGGGDTLPLAGSIIAKEKLTSLSGSVLPACAACPVSLNVNLLFSLRCTETHIF